MNGAYIHRFRDKVAISLPGKGPTVYLTPKEARQIAKALNACARDVKALSFTASEFSSTSVDISAPGVNE